MKRIKTILMDFAEVLDAYRVVPRAIVLAYGYMLYDITQWYMGLPEPSNPQATFISVVYGASAGMFAFYANTGRQWVDKSVHKP